jgi:riboflavin synthase
MEQRGESWLLIVEAPAALARYFAYKGSVTVNGVSLTVNQVEDVLRGGERAGCNLWINLIPHTVAVTTLVQLKPGDRVNLEVDMLARYVERMLSLQAR